MFIYDRATAHVIVSFAISRHAITGHDCSKGHFAPLCSFPSGDRRLRLPDCWSCARGHPRSARVGTDRHCVTHNALGLPWLPQAGLGEAVHGGEVRHCGKQPGAQGTQMSRMPPLSLRRISTSVPPDPGCFMSNTCRLEFGGSSATRAVFCRPYVSSGVVINADSCTRPQVR